MKKLKVAFWLICFLIACWNVDSYRLGVERRALIDTWKWTYSDSPDGQYTLAFGSGYGDWVWVKLRRKGDSEVLADRWFETPFLNIVFWRDDRVAYRRDTGDVIYLPPIWLEKWMAKLP